MIATITAEVFGRPEAVSTNTQSVSPLARGIVCCSRAFSAMRKSGSLLCEMRPCASSAIALLEPISPPYASAFSLSHPP